ncbi:hypothetical protein T03_6140 [Trichinella britovi]|uniref:Uncharacterized protein n=1 Tax=Trichinella britovi TaxID=45882 RepID=A0A0V1DDE7_TRIBR|nr:hypothetical protein T03_6140 [Trichinella britovi]KRZ94978.1 hypothetical protein T08_16134 [Trichinella sp. T8]
MEKIVSDIREHFQKLYQLAANCLNVLFVAVSLHYLCDRWSQTLKKELCNVGSFLNVCVRWEGDVVSAKRQMSTSCEGGLCKQQHMD